MKLSVHWTDNMPSKTKEVNKIQLSVKICNKPTYLRVFFNIAVNHTKNKKI